MKFIKSILIIFLHIFVLASCLTPKQTNLLRESDGKSTSFTVSTVKEYTIKPGDELSINMTFPSESQETAALFTLFSGSGAAGTGNEKIRTVSVSPEGVIYIPHIGNMSVLGKTTLEIQNKIEDEINSNFLSESECLVYVSLDNRYFSVIGESRTGRYPIAKEQLTIFQALSQSGDVNAYGDRSKIKVIRQTDSGTEIRRFDLRSEDIINSEYYYIQPNDIIYIQPMKRQFWGINSFGSIFAIVSTVASLGITIYNFTK